jgi:hypothetical protein
VIKTGSSCELDAEWAKSETHSEEREEQGGQAYSFDPVKTVSTVKVSLSTEGRMNSRYTTICEKVTSALPNKRIAQPLVRLNVHLLPSMPNNSLDESDIPIRNPAITATPGSSGLNGETRANNSRPASPSPSASSSASHRTSPLRPPTPPGTLKHRGSGRRYADYRSTNSADGRASLVNAVPSILTAAAALNTLLTSSLCPPPEDVNIFSLRSTTPIPPPPKPPSKLHPFTLRVADLAPAIFLLRRRELGGPRRKNDETRVANMVLLEGILTLLDGFLLRREREEEVGAEDERRELEGSLIRAWDAENGKGEPLDCS